MAGGDAPHPRRQSFFEEKNTIDIIEKLYKQEKKEDKINEESETSEDENEGEGES